MKKSVLCLAAAIALYLFLSDPGVRSQERGAPKIEIGAQFSTLELNPPDTFGTDTQPGLGGRFTYNLTDHIAVEAEANFLPQKRFFGRTTQGQFGVKAGKRFERFGLFAKARPGFVSFAESFTIVPLQAKDFQGNPIIIPEFRFERQTHFSIDVGGVLEFYPSRHVVTRFDIGDTVIRYGPRNDVDFSRPVPVFRRPTDYQHNFQLSAGVAFRFMNPDGGSETSAPEREDTPRFEAGVQYTSLSINPPRQIFGFPVISGPPFTFTEPAVGGRFTFNLTDTVALEAATDLFTKEIFSGPTFGGHAVQGQFGVKAGKRFERFGLFAKARPGFISYSEVLQLVNTTTINFGGRIFPIGIFERGRKTYFSTDVGGVLEFYPSRRVVTRFDIGDTIIRYRDRAAPSFFVSIPFIRQPDETKHNFQFSTGIGFRF